MLDHKSQEDILLQSCGTKQFTSHLGWTQLEERTPNSQQDIVVGSEEAHFEETM
jgi:hypothetical protein